MTRPFEGHHSRREAQFGLRSLFEYVTLCSILLALSSVLGVATSLILMLMGLALWARRGWIALAMLMAASLAADGSFDLPNSGLSMVRQIAVILLAASLCSWYCVRPKNDS